MYKYRLWLNIYFKVCFRPWVINYSGTRYYITTTSGTTTSRILLVTTPSSSTPDAPSTSTRGTTE